MARSTESEPGWGSWKMSAVVVGLAPWIVPPRALDATGLTGIWYQVGFFGTALGLIGLAAVWLVPQKRGRGSRSPSAIPR